MQRCMYPLEIITIYKVLYTLLHFRMNRENLPILLTLTLQILTKILVVYFGVIRGDHCDASLGAR